MRRNMQLSAALIAMMIGFAYFAYREGLFEARPKIIGFYVDHDPSSLVSLKANIKKMDQLIPVWVHLSGVDGGITVSDRGIQDSVVAFVKKQKPDMFITPLVNNFNSKTENWDGKSLAKMLENPKARARNIQAILDFVRSNHFEGVSIDYENVPNSSQKDLILFMSELYARFHPLGLQVTQCIPLHDRMFDAKKLSKSCDHLILMAYDEHPLGISLAGPIASQSWFEKGIAMRTAQVGKRKFIVALGGYGYDWKGNSVSGSDLTFQEVMEVAKRSKSRIDFDKEAQNPTFDYHDENGRVHHVWFLDARTFSNEIGVAKGVYGYALWRLGSEDPSIWKIIQP